ncbi:hypothetical protein [Massilia sp. TWR1-2-2]|uniref:hypothetical protein n=1 Tax=Massilia sp. TWR1-2-2 TaxID=2804584 RepID=UPI003CF1D4B9
MRTLILLPLAFALVYTTSTAAPYPGDRQLRRESGQTYQPRPMEVAEVTGVYELDNGETVKISVERRSLYARIGLRAPIQLVAVAEHKFVSVDRRVTLQFKPIAFGDQIVLTYPVAPGQVSRGTPEVVAQHRDD